MVSSVSLFFSLAISFLASAFAAIPLLRGGQRVFTVVAANTSSSMQERWCFGGSNEQEAEEIEERFREEVCEEPDGTAGNASMIENVRPLFLKFHKVGGTTIMNMVNGFLQIPVECGGSCGECGCPDGRAVACTGHHSITIVKELTKKNTFRHSDEELLKPGMIMARSSRKVMLDSIGSPPWMHWFSAGIPRHQVVLMTLLRSPIERIRSKYYFLRTRKNCTTQSFCNAKRLSFAEWMRKEGRDRNVCCEYVDTLGGSNVGKAKVTLATFFDVVGITESMDEMRVEVARIFGAARPNVKPDMNCRSNSENKQSWTAEELAIATRISSEDTEIYDFAVRLSKVRMLSSWGSEAAIQNAIEAYRQGARSSTWKSWLKSLFWR